MVQEIEFVISPPDLGSAIARLGDLPAFAVPLLGETTRQRFLTEADHLVYRRALPVVGEGPRAVRQEFDLCYDLPPDSPFHDLAEAFEAQTLAALTSLTSSPVSLPFAYNDRIVQRYNPGEAGITPHRDHIAYEGLVALIILETGGRFLTCTERSGEGAAEVHCPPGGVILMRGPGYGGRRDRPFHLLKDIDRRRISYGLRYDIRKI